MQVLEGVRPTDDELIACIDAAHARVGRAERELLGFVAQMGERNVWISHGARDYAHWLSMRLGISGWKARRLIASAHALQGLPLVSSALEEGHLGLDKVMELTRFAGPADEADLISWAQGVSGAAIRHRGDLEIRRAAEEVLEDEKNRSVQWWYGSDGRFGLEAYLPPAQGAVVAKALERLADQVPVMPGEERDSVSRRRADALVALASVQLSSDQDPDRATVIVHARLEALEANSGGSEIEGGPVIDPEVTRRLLCSARVQEIVEDEGANVVWASRMRREPSAALERQVRYRDKECRFPGCGAKRFTQVHHLAFWSRGGKTELANLLLICFFHHRLVHEYGWKVTRSREGLVRWFDRGGVQYRAGPGP